MNPFVVLATVALALGLAPLALAGGTPSNTQVDNTATLTYTVGSTLQAPVTSNTVSFLVDNKIDLTVTTVDAAIVEVVPGTFAQVLTYSVRNDGNTVQDYSLQALDSATGAFGETESFDASNVNVFVDSDGDDAYTAGTDTDLFIDELGIDASITVFVVADIDLAQVNGDVASYDLVAQTAVGGTGGSQGADILTDDFDDADDPTLVQTVFADGTGTADGPRDGAFSSKDGYKVVTADLTVVKTADVVSDPFNGGTNPKAIPGATMGYQILVTNNGTVAASNVTIVDSVPANSAFLVGSVASVPAAGTVVSYSNDNGLTWAYGPVAGANGTDPAVTDVRVIFVSVGGGGVAQESFQVLID
jgi:uncharacterized repeat protein (TIGR01451 family)